MKSVTVANVLQVINQVEGLDISQDQLEENLFELGMDSLTFIRVVVALEENFECEIPDEKLLITEMDTVDKVLKVLQSLYDMQNDTYVRKNDYDD